MKNIVYAALVLLTFGAQAKINVGRSFGDSFKEVVDIACVQAAKAARTIKRDKDSDKSYPVVQDAQDGSDSWVEWYQKEF